MFTGLTARALRDGGFIMWEVFKADGQPVVRTRFKLLARLWAWWLEADYAREGDGWL